MWACRKKMLTEKASVKAVHFMEWYRDNVGIETRYRLDGWGIEFRWG